MHSQLQYSENRVISAMYIPNSNYLVGRGSKLSFWTCSSLNAAKTKKKLQNSQPRTWPYEFWVAFIKPLSVQEYVHSFQNNTGCHLHPVFSDEFIMPTVMFLIYDSIFSLLYFCLIKWSTWFYLQFKSSQRFHRVFHGFGTHSFPSN